MLSARFLGGASLHTPAGVLVGPPAQRHRLALVALLALSRSRPTSRDKLVATLWPNRDAEHGRGLLKQSVHTLRQALGRHAIVSAGDALALNGEVIACDVTGFESALAAGELDRAVSIYAGPLLDGFHLPDAPDFERWIDSERDRLRRACLEALEHLAEMAEARGDASGAVELRRRIASEEPYSGRATLRLMEALDAAGDRAGAIQHARAHALLLHRELEAEPDAEVRALADRLRADPLGVVRARTGERAPPRVKAPVLRTATSGPGAPVSTRYALAGRDAEWSRLRGAWTVGAAHGSHLALILGEAGIGKTRLGEEMLEWASRQGIATARTRCYAAEGRLPYAPVAEWLRAPALQAGLGALDPEWLSEVVRILPELRQTYPDLPGLDLNAAWHRQRLFAALARAIVVRAEPTVLLVDDLQWCDQDTLDWLHYLLRFDAEARLLVVGTARDDEVTPEHPLTKLVHELRRERKVTPIELHALSADDTATLAASVAGLALPPELAAELYRETEGQPLFVVESVRSRVLDPARPATHNGSVAPGVSASVGGGGATSMLGDLASLPLPVQSVIQARLTRLSPPARTLAGVAATVGRDFTMEVLARACEPNEDVVGSLDELCARRIIREQGAGRFDFSHDKLREVAYRTIGPARRRMLHRRVADALASVHARDLDAVSGQIAAHYEHAGVPEQAVMFYQRAAEVANRIHANAEAVNLLQRALRILAALPDSVERKRRELALLTALCAPLRASRGWAALELAETTSRARALSDEIGTDSERLTVMWEQTSFQVVRGDLRSALETSDDAFRLALAHGDPALLTPAHSWMGNPRCQRGEFADAREHHDRAVALYDRRHHGRYLALFGADFGVFAGSFHAHTLWHLGYPERALGASRQAIALAEELAHPFSRAIALAYDATLHQFRNDPEATRRQAIAAADVSTEYGFVYYVAWASILHGWALAVQGKARSGIAKLRSGITAIHATGAELRRSYYLSLLAEACALYGQASEGLEVIAEALRVSENSSEHWKDADLHRLRGELLLMVSGGEDDAESSFRQALTVAERQNARMLELRAALGLGRLLQRQGRGREASDVIAPLYGWFTEGFDSRDLVEARALLAQLS